MVQEKKCRSAKGLKILYISVMALCTAVLIVLIVIFTGLTIAEFCLKAQVKEKGKTGVYDWLEEKGLA